MAGADVRPADCRERLRDEWKPYPRSGCAVCKTGGMTGCPHKTGGPASRTPIAYVNFYAKGNHSSHFTRELADLFSDELPTNPRIACIAVSAEIGEGLANAEGGAGPRLLKSLQEVHAMVSGEKPAASMFHMGHSYVPESAVAAERARCADIVATRLRRHSGDIEIAPILRQLEAAIRGDAP